MLPFFQSKPDLVCLLSVYFAEILHKGGIVCFCLFIFKKRNPLQTVGLQLKSLLLLGACYPWPLVPQEPTNYTCYRLQTLRLR